MRIQDTFEQDGISYESGDELSETDTDLRSSQERIDVNDSFSSVSFSKDRPGNPHPLRKSIETEFAFSTAANPTAPAKYTTVVPTPYMNSNVRDLEFLSDPVLIVSRLFSHMPIWSKNSNERQSCARKV